LISDVATPKIGSAKIFTSGLHEGFSEEYFRTLFFPQKRRVSLSDCLLFRKAGAKVETNFVLQSPLSKIFRKIFFG
jgi:hypothetical protein